MSDINLFSKPCMFHDTEIKKYNHFDMSLSSVFISHILQESRLQNLVTLKGKTEP